jgi:RimJ/RimL family protein N-acetyltransferase
VAGTVQATLSLELGDAALAWVIGSRFQGCGYAKEAAAGMAEWLVARGVRVLVAHVHPGHGASIAVARHLGIAATDEEVDGEVRWVRAIGGE